MTDKYGKPHGTTKYPGLELRHPGFALRYSRFALRSSLWVSLAVIMLLLLLTGGCAQKPSEPQTRREIILGTYCTLIIHDTSVKEAHFTSVFERVREIENRMTLLGEESEISEVNRMAGKSPVKVSPDTFYVVNKGVEYGELTRGEFDISVGPLVKLWGIGGKNQDRGILPEREDIENLLPLVDYRNIVLDHEAHTVYLREPGMAIDLGGIAKGYAVDEADRILREAGIQHAVIDFGGDVRVIGTRGDGAPWRIGVQDPVNSSRGNYLGILSVTDKSVVTSGDYERFFIQDGIRFHHILDISTGYPSRSGLRSVTIVSDNALDGDVLSTAVFILGLEEGIELVKGLEGIEGILVTLDNKVFVSPRLREIFSMPGTRFTPLAPRD